MAVLIILRLQRYPILDLDTLDYIYLAQNKSNPENVNRPKVNGITRCSRTNARVMTWNCTTIMKHVTLP